MFHFCDNLHPIIVSEFFSISHSTRSLLLLGLSTLDLSRCEQGWRCLLTRDFFELLILGDSMRLEHWLVDLTQQSLALAHALTEFQVANRVAAQVVCQVVDDAQWFVLQQLHGCRVGFSD